MNSEHASDIQVLLRSKGISPTSQRLEIARLLFGRHAHLSADEVFRLVNSKQPSVSKATVYNTLALFVERGLIRQVIADPTRIYYDPNTEPHHHIFDTSSGWLTDISLDSVEVHGLPQLSTDYLVEGIDVIVRVRSKRDT
jgi:Fur family iron response transcriptional regulator